MGEERQRGRTQKYQLRYNSITASIEREEKGETLPGVPLHQTLPAACYESWIKSYGPAPRMSSLNQTVSDPIHFKPVIWSPYLIWSAFVIYYERECDGEESEEAVLRSFWLDAVHQLLFNWWHREIQKGVIIRPLGIWGFWCDAVVWRHTAAAGSIMMKIGASMCTESLQMLGFGQGGAAIWAVYKLCRGAGVGDRVFSGICKIEVGGYYELGLPWQSRGCYTVVFAVYLLKTDKKR